MADQTRIYIQLGEVKHALYVDRDDEPLYREAGRLLAQRWQAYADKYSGVALPREHLMSFAALDVALRYVRLSRRADTEAAEADLAALVAEMRRFADDAGADS